MGMCGIGCDGIGKGNAYTQDCFDHDMCTYFNDKDHAKHSGPFDKNCAQEFEDAVADFLFGSLHCGRNNGKNPLHYTDDVVPDQNPWCKYPGGEWFENDFGRSEKEADMGWKR